jgi:hypothetical protein
MRPAGDGVNPVSLVVWALSDATAWLVLGVCALAVVAAFVVFGGGWE